MKNKKCYFKSQPKDLPWEEYQEVVEHWQVEPLKQFVSELESGGRIDHSDVRKINDGQWSLWCRQEGHDPENHVCYLSSEAPKSSFEQVIYSTNKDAVPSGISQKRLVVQTPRGRPGDDAKSDERGYQTVSVESYINTMDSVKGSELSKVIYDIKSGVASRFYRVEGDTFVVQIDLPEVAYGVHISCTLMWEG